MTITAPPAPAVEISRADWLALFAFWAADEALTDSDIAFQHVCAPFERAECGCPDLPSPVREASFRALDTLARELLPGAVVDRLYADLRSSFDGIEASLARVGVRSR